MKYGLLGKNVSQSYSQEIHAPFLEEEYQLISVKDENDFLAFLKSDFAFANVTSPYKSSAYIRMDEVDEVAKITKTVNLIIRKENKLYGYNTDMYGFMTLLHKNHIHTEDKNVLILGTGASSRSVCYALHTLGCNHIRYLSRHPDHHDSFGYDELDSVKEAEIIINATPIGQNEENNVLLIKDIEKFPNLKWYVDINYHFIHSAQSIYFKEHGVNTVNGLYMLVAQGIRSEEIYHHTAYPETVYQKSYLSLFAHHFSLALSGHSFAGKSLNAPKVAEELGMISVDTDQEIIRKENLSFAAIFQEKGEAYFRKKETQVIEEAVSRVGQVIALGGGAILNENNRSLLYPYSLVMNLEKDPAYIEDKDIESRPLIQDKEALINQITVRKESYQKYSDKQVSYDPNENTVSLIIRRI